MLRIILRGGSWSYSLRFAASASRYFNHPDFRYYLIGFRVVEEDAAKARVVRGGSFNYLDAWSVRCAVRAGRDPGSRYVNGGFRIVEE